MRRTWKRIAGISSGILLGLVVMGAAAHQLVPHSHAPDSTEFGLGPRRSANGLYRATIQADRPLAAGPMTTIRLAVEDAAGDPLSGAAITVEGGMPAHHHGLPTRPRVTRELAAGLYQVEGVRFSMGGWWVLTFRIDGRAGVDSLTFNIQL